MAMKPAFKRDGTVTAGNASGVNDGAAALVNERRKAKELGIKPLAKLLSPPASALTPKSWASVLFMQCPRP